MSNVSRRLAIKTYFWFEGTFFSSRCNEARFRCLWTTPNPRNVIAILVLGVLCCDVLSSPACELFLSGGLCPRTSYFCALTAAHILRIRMRFFWEPSQTDT